eukprot:m.716813 g.716813  ORF g.716813 m.716813 type:complete len:68 (+) comp22984_c1_seq61:1680-1883(+)
MPGALQAYLLHLNGVERLIAALPKVSEEEATKLIRKAHHVYDTIIPRTSCTTQAITIRTFRFTYLAI